MANLIITIISIALVAVAAVMGVFYGGTAFQNAQINATANAIINEANQILAAERIWSANNAQTDISGMGTAGASGTGMSMLVNSKTLATWPTFGGNIGVSTTGINAGAQPWLGWTGSAASVATGTYDFGCYLIGGYFGIFTRILFSYNNSNYVLYDFTTNLSGSPSSCASGNNGNFVSSTSDVSQFNHPVVKIVKAINAILNRIPANANMATMPYIGIPAPPVGSAWGLSYNIYDVIGSTIFMDHIRVDSNNILQSNYCYFAYNYNNPPYSSIACVFGPS